MILTNDESIFRQAMAYRVHGSGMNGYYTYGKRIGTDVLEESIDFHGNLPKYYNFVTGKNSRLDEIQAAILNVKLPHLDTWNARRREIAAKYDEGIVNPAVRKPYIADHNIPIYYVYVIVTEKRDELRRYLYDNGVASGVYFPVPLHLQKAFEELGYQKGDMPNAELIAEKSLVLPMFPELTQSEIHTIIDVINSWCEN